MTVTGVSEARQRRGVPAAVRTSPSLHPPTVGLVAQLAVLAVLAAWVGIGGAGWLLAGAYALATWLLLTRALQQPGRLVRGRSAATPAGSSAGRGGSMERAGEVAGGSGGVRGWGPADTVTLARGTLVGGVAALVVDSMVGAPAPVVVLVGMAAVALALDGVDGQVARRTGTASRLGARFDVEVDAVLVLVLSLYVAQSLGWWVVAIGAIRYAFVAAAWALPWLRASLPPRRSRKVVAATQGIVLVVASAAVLPVPLAYATVGLALAVLVWSFGRDIEWMWRSRVPAWV